MVEDGGGKLAFWYPVSQFSSDLATALKISRFQKLDHLTCTGILRINPNKTTGLIHVIEERHK